LGGFLLVGVPLIERFSARQQGLEPGIGAALFEYVCDLIVIVRQDIPGEAEDETGAQIEVPFGWYRQVFLLVQDIAGQLVGIVVAGRGGILAIIRGGRRLVSSSKSSSPKSQ
jgi:hypothetical protein